MDVLEVLGSADTILPMVATTMTTSAATSASAACPGQLSHAGNEPTTNGQQQANRKESTGQLVGQQATASGHQSQGQHTTAPSEQTQEAHAAASAEQRSAGLHLNALDQQPAGQHQTASNAGASLAEQHQDDVGADSAGQGHTKQPLLLTLTLTPAQQGRRATSLMRPQSGCSQCRLWKAM